MLALVCGSISVLHAQGTIEVTTPEVESSEGQVVFLLYNQSEGFPNEWDKAYRIERVKAREGAVGYTFSNVPFGNYAVAIAHDENNNGEIDSNFIGFPKESVGASNQTSMGRPTFEKSKVTLAENRKKLVLNIPFIN